MGADSGAQGFSRREFLTRSVALTGAAAFSSIAMGAPSFGTDGRIRRNTRAMADPDRKLRIGVVGGAFGASFQWHEHPNCVVEAVSDLRPERRKRLMDTYHCDKAYGSLKELVLDKDVEAVAVFTEAPNHVRHSVKVLEHGKHVISAVPACFATVEEAEQLLDAVQRSGLKYMMAETSYYQNFTISARDLYQRGEMGEIFYCESEYLHDGLEALYWEDANGYNAEGRGKRTWRYGLAPMHYPTHCTAHLISLTGERPTEVSCVGWGDDASWLKDNDYGNPFHNESALFQTNRGNAFRVRIWWKAPTPDGERAEWFGTKMSFYGPQGAGRGPRLFRTADAMGKDDAGFPVALPEHEEYQQKDWYMTDMLPEALRHSTGHADSHAFLTHEFVDAVLNDRKPAIDVYEALAYTVPGIIAHQSALRDGEQMKIPQFDA